ncbi:MAG: hypothetical protein PHE86_02090 [Candidatus Marinimicrobia bacterium]|nr:hypothetical protein [Candidatus Neomarinimicrobiota bacterium]
MKYNPEEHHRQSIRLKDYDYSQPGAYFVTICTQNQECLFGKIVDGKMVLNECGKITKQCWLDIPNHYSNAELDEFVIMPNHIHGIIIIVGGINVGAIHESPQHESPLPPHSTITRRKMLLPKIIGFYKMNSAKQINQIRHMPGTPVWQRNYYEHIIRNENENELNRVHKYIINNPLQWQ